MLQKQIQIACNGSPGKWIIALMNDENIILLIYILLYYVTVLAGLALLRRQWGPPRAELLQRRIRGRLQPLRVPQSQVQAQRAGYIPAKLYSREIDNARLVPSAKWVMSVQQLLINIITQTNPIPHTHRKPKQNNQACFRLVKMLNGFMCTVHWRFKEIWNSNLNSNLFCNITH